MIVDFAADISLLGRLFVFHNPIITGTMQVFSFGWELVATVQVSVDLAASCTQYAIITGAKRWYKSNETPS